MASQPTTDPATTLTADGSPSLRHPLHGETYHSHHGAASEARHVFVEAAGIEELLRDRGTVEVVEVGFGTGLNFLMTAAARQNVRGELHYTGIEATPLPPALLERTGFDHYAPRPEIWELVRSALEAANRGDPEPQGSTDEVHLSLQIDDATRVHRPPARADAVYLDAFSPANAPNLWSAAFLERLLDWLRPGGALVTYCAQGRFRRRLATLGFGVERLPGPPGGKREMTRATRPA